MKSIGEPTTNDNPAPSEISLGEACKLFFLSLFYKWRFSKEERQIKRLYYSDPQFLECDMLFHALYADCNPYTVSKEFLLQKGSQEIDLYGETPLSTWSVIAKECDITSQDHVIDLGCGRGRGLFFLHCKWGCSVHGIEWIPQFVDTSQKIAATLKFSKITFSCDDMFQSERLETTLQKASCIYLYGTCLNADALTYLTALFKKLRPGTKIVTVSEPLQEEEGTSHFKRIKSFQGIFPWGMTEFYLHEVQ